MYSQVWENPCKNNSCFCLYIAGPLNPELRYKTMDVGEEKDPLHSLFLLHANKLMQTDYYKHKKLLV